MSFSIKNLINLDLLNDAAIVGGKNGIHNEIIWVNMMEILDQLGSLQKGELLLTTGYGLENEDIHRDLISNLHKKGLAGIAIQPGYYIDEIPDYIINEGEKYGFPIIKVPKKITFSHLTRTILKNIGNNIKSNIELTVSDNILAHFIEENHGGNEDISRLEAIGKYSTTDANLHILVLSVKHSQDGIISKSDINLIATNISDFFTKISGDIIIEDYVGKIIILFHNGSNDKIQYIANELNSIITKLSQYYNNFNFSIGISNKFNTINGIQRAYFEASASQEILEKHGAKKGICLYEHINLLQFLGQPGSSVNNLKFINNTLKPIIEYDKVHRCNYIETLKIYLINNRNINAASEKLFIHRHTLSYRLERITELFNIDFDDYATFLKYSIALWLYDLY